MPEAMKSSRGLMRRNAILDAATTLFLERGYARTSLSAIIERSKGSRSTIYDQFGNKEGLLIAIIRNIGDNVWAEIDKPQDPQMSLEEWLVDFSLRFMRILLSPMAMATFRIMTTETQIVPKESVRMFFTQGPEYTRQRVNEHFAKLFGVSNDVHELVNTTRVFLGAVMGDFFFTRAIGMSTQLSDDEIEKHIRLAVKVFLRGISFD